MSTIVLSSPQEIKIDGLSVGSAIDAIANWPSHAVAVQTLVDAYEAWRAAPKTGPWSHDPVTVTVPPPPAPAPPAPPADSAEAAIRGNIGMLALMREIADFRGITEAQMIASIRSRA